VQQLTGKLITLLAVTAAVGFGAAFALARSGSGDDGTTPTPARTTLPTVASPGVDQTVRAVGAAAPLPDLRRRPRTNTQTTPPRTTTTSPPPTTTTQPPPPPTTTQSRPPPTTTQSPPTVTTG
jgi:hypothetical protein